MLWPAPGRTARSAPSRSSRTSQTASNAGWCAPEITSFGKAAAASVEWDLGFPGRSLGDRGAGSLLERRRQRLGLAHAASDDAEKAAQVRRRFVRARGEERGQLGNQPFHLGPPAGDPERRRLAHRQRTNTLRLPRRDEERDDSAVRVADEMCSILEQRRQLLGLFFEVDLLERRIRRIATPVRDHELEALA